MFNIRGCKNPKSWLFCKCFFKVGTLCCNAVQCCNAAASLYTYSMKTDLLEVFVRSIKRLRLTQIAYADFYSAHEKILSGLMKRISVDFSVFGSVTIQYLPHA